MHTVQLVLPSGAMITLARLHKGGQSWLAMRQLFNAMTTIMPFKSHHWQTVHAIVTGEGEHICQHACTLQAILTVPTLL